jgi:hypothetical protein
LRDAIHRHAARRSGPRDGGLAIEVFAEDVEGPATPAVSPAVSAANRMGIGLLMVTMLADDALPPGAGFSTVTL